MSYPDLCTEARLIVAKSDANDRGKWLPLHFHLLDTAGIMSRLINIWLSPAARQALAGGLDSDTLCQVAAFLALAHDLGKATPAFQQKIVGCIDDKRGRMEQYGLSIPALPNAQESPHPLAGEALLRDAGVPEGIASIVGAHHGRTVKLKPDFDVYQLKCLCDNYWGRGEGAGWRRVQTEYINWALTGSGFGSASKLPVLSLPVQMLLTGLLIMADWIASCTRHFPLIDIDDLNPAYDPTRVDAAWSRLGLQEGWTPEGGIPLDELCQRRFCFDRPNVLQTQTMRLVNEASQPGLMIIEAQMGSGKTEAALLAAELMSDGMNGPKRGGIFFGLPTQATANGIFDRVRAWGESQTKCIPATIKLAHGAAELNESYAQLMKYGGSMASLDVDGDSGMMVNEWFRGPKQALLSDFVVGTVDQLLMLALKQRHVMLRHLGLCGKVVIVDECHAYDAYMNQYLEAALQWLGVYRVPVILLSATLPSERRGALIDAYLHRRSKKDSAPWRTCRDYPLLTWTDGGEVYQRALTADATTLNVAIERLSDGEGDETLSARLQGALCEGGCAGIIVNTVRRAQELARMIRERFPDFTVLLLHAQYILPDRTEKEKQLLRRVGPKSTSKDRNQLIIVGTQVCEQSLDLDFDLLITELCPMDLLLQRMGRLHRHGYHDAERPRPLQNPRCLVLGADETLSRGSVAVYGEYLLLRTRALLPSSVVLPDDIPRLVQDIYDDSILLPQTPEGYAEAREKHIANQSKRRKNANTFRLKLPEPTGFAELDTLDNLLEAGLATEEQGQQAVRDGDPSIEVLVLRQSGNGLQTLVGGEYYCADHVPNESTCREIAAQKLRLPHALCVPWIADKVIDELTVRRKALREWLQSPWLRGQLFLLLDENSAAELCGITLRYERDYGLIVEEVPHASH